MIPTLETQDDNFQTQYGAEAFVTFQQKVEKPRFFPIPIVPFDSVDDLKEMRRISEQHWFEQFDAQEFSRMASLYQEGSREKDVYRYFKNVRKPGLIMRSSFRYDDKEGGVPKELLLFLKKLGKFNDAFYSNYGNEALSIVLELLPTLPQGLFERNPQELIQALQQLHSDLEFILIQCPHNRTEALPVKKFHQLRIMLKHIMNVFQLRAFQSGDQNLKECFAYLHEIVSNLGDIHDNVIQNTLGDRDSYKSSQVTLTAVQIHKIKSFCIPLIQKVQDRIYSLNN